MPPEVVVKVWGDYACFTRPELKVERLSYPLMTPSAARGVLEAILWKPQMRWHVRRITVLRHPENDSGLPYELRSVRRNEIQGKIPPRTVGSWMSDPTGFAPYLVDSAGREGVQGENRTQRNTVALCKVAYVVHATPLLSPRANQPRRRPEDEDEEPGPDSVAKYVGMFQRRVRKGQCFHRPYLGCREFAAHFAPPDGTETVVDWGNDPPAGEDLGPMLYDLRHGEDGRCVPGFFRAVVRRGELHCDTLDPGPAGEAPIRVLGWESEGSAEAPR